MDTFPSGRPGAACNCQQCAAMPAARAAAGLPALLRPIVDVGSRVTVQGTADELRGHMTERFTYADGSPGAFVELESGNVIRVPVRDLRAAP